MNSLFFSLRVDVQLMIAILTAVFNAESQWQPGFPLMSYKNKRDGVQKNSKMPQPWLSNALPCYLFWS